MLRGGKCITEVYCLYAYLQQEKHELKHEMNKRKNKKEQIQINEYIHNNAVN